MPAPTHVAFRTSGSYACSCVAWVAGPADTQSSITYINCFTAATQHFGETCRIVVLSCAVRRDITRWLFVYVGHDCTNYKMWHLTCPTYTSNLVELSLSNWLSHLFETVDVLFASLQVLHVMWLARRSNAKHALTMRDKNDCTFAILGNWIFHQLLNMLFLVSVL